ncbi:MAG: COR domain-containing protein [Verrucomicrobiia bacterium]|jgi:internalin A
MRKTIRRLYLGPKQALAEAERLIVRCRRARAQRLDLDGLSLLHLPESLRSLTWLKELNAHRNKITQLPVWLGELTELRSLDVHSNPLQAVPTSLSRLVRLELLRIDSGSVSAADKVIGSLVNLRELAIARLGLTRVPDWVRGLRNLETLYLFNNRLTELPEWLCELAHLQYLSVHGNRLESLPTSILQLRSLRHLNIRGNPALRLPTEIVDSDDPWKILTYYARIQGPEDRQPLNEFKLILVGRGGVGKTTLVHRLVADKYKEFRRTPGINITKWPARIDGEDVRAHVWDFGGQEIMHGTHRFFMTERALYLMLISGREGTEDHDAEYWLSLVRSFGGDAPVLVLLHKWDDYHFELNRELLREKYGRGLVFLETDSKSGFGIRELRDHICRQAKKLSGLKSAWPAEWRRIKEELPKKKKSWLSFDSFCAFCSKRGIANPKDQEDLAESLHDLGLMLSYRKEESLRGFGVLNPQWVTKGIYEMLNSRTLRKACGKFTVKTFADVLSSRKYPVKLHPYLLALMRKFRLCHPLDDKGEHYLIPELLTKKEPKLDAQFPPKKCLGFIYRYDAAFPEGLLPRFIVETYVHREPKLAWRTGVVLERANCRAVVRGDLQGRTVTIRVAGVGSGQRELLGIIREHFEHIHGSYEKLPVTEMVPIPGFPDSHVKHELLLKYERARRETIAVEVGDELRDVSVKKLLDGVDLPGAPRRKDVEQLTLFQQDRRGQRKRHSLFISYSHKDELFRDELRGALTAYERKGEITAWDDTRIEPGQKWEAEILGKLEEAAIIVLLLSNDFIRSDYCMQKEMKRALERDAAGECAIVPIVVRACPFTKLDLGRIQAIQPNGKPIKQHKDRDAAWLEVSKQLDRVIARLKKR